MHQVVKSSKFNSASRQSDQDLMMANMEISQLEKRIAVLESEAEDVEHMRQQVDSSEAVLQQL